MADSASQIPPRAKNKTSGQKSPMFWFGIFIIAILLLAIGSWAYHSAGNEEKDLEKNLALQQKQFTESRAETANSWLVNLSEPGMRLVRNEAFQAFASAVDELGDNIVLLLSPDKDSGKTSEELQLALMRSYLNDTVSLNQLLSARMLNRKGETYLATSNFPEILNSEQLAMAKDCVLNNTVIFAPIRYTESGLVLDIYLPVPQMQGGGQNRAVASLMISKIISSNVNEWLRFDRDEKLRRAFLVQRGGEVWQLVGTGREGVQNLSPLPADENGDIPFGVRNSLRGDQKVYSKGSKVRGMNWWIVEENDYSAARADLIKTQSGIYGMAALGGLVVVLLVGLVWWWVVGHSEKARYAEIQSLFQVIDEQKRLLDGINSTISDPISLADEKGVYRYVNRAFAQAVGRDPGEVPGLDTAAVFGFDTAKRLNAADQRVLMTLENSTISEVIWLQSRKHYFQISKTPLRDPGSRAPKGIVSVFRDITTIVETEEHGRRVVQQTIDALVRTIEEMDPFLGGHSRIMGGIAVLIAKAMHLTDRDVATIEAAANLSQLGKMFVPREILTKPGVLTPQEKELMEKHVDYAREALKEIEFDLPVLEAICQMNEKLDGTGYPAGLKGDEINVYAKILAVANAFTAMARPRSYRPAMKVEDAVNILTKQADSYDQVVVSTLQEILKTPAGEKFAQMAAASKAV